MGQLPESDSVLLLLDLDGTLCDSRRTMEAALCHAFKGFGHRLKTSDVEQALACGHTLRGTVTALLGCMGDPDETRAITIEASYLQAYPILAPTLTKLYQGVASTLSRLSAAGLPMTVVTNKSRAEAVRCLTRTGLLKHFFAVISPPRGAVGKPDIAFYQRRVVPRISSVCHNRHRQLIVGDTRHDLEFARNIGTDCCWAAYGYGRPSDCLEMNPRFVINKFSDIVDII
jgi:phosphoglycolate phosphatase